MVITVALMKETYQDNLTKEMEEQPNVLFTRYESEQTRSPRGLKPVSSNDTGANQKTGKTGGQTPPSGAAKVSGQTTGQGQGDNVLDSIDAVGFVA